MLSVERTTAYRQLAEAQRPGTVDPVLGTINACASGKYQLVTYARDGDDSITQAYSEPGNFRLPGFLDAAKATLALIVAHQGTKLDPKRDEQPGRDPHEIHTEYSPQDRLVLLERAGMPVTFDPITKKRKMVNYFAGDATSKTNQAIVLVSEVISEVESPKEGEEFLAGFWPNIKAGVEHELDTIRRFDPRLPKCLRGLPVLNPQNNCNFVFQIWRDGLDAYRGDDGILPKPPLVSFSNACHTVKGLEQAAKAADRLGYTREMRDWQDMAERVQAKLEVFWMDDLQMYAPIYSASGPTKFVSCDAVDGLYCGVIPDKRAQSVVDRYGQPDMLTPFGVGTRSTNSPFYTEAGYESYQNGAIWLNRNTMAILGMARYGFITQALDLLDRTENYIGQSQFRELKLYDRREGVLKDYLEDGEPVACDAQSFGLYGYEGTSAWFLRLVEEHHPAVGQLVLAA